MPQRTSNLYSLVTVPGFYRRLMVLVGADSLRTRLANEVIRARPGMKVLDAGCGPASLLPYLPAVDYTGIDVNPRHIEYAKSRYGGRARFVLGDVAKDLPGEEGSYDLAIVSAVLHHLDDQQAHRLLEGLCRLVKPGGRIVTFDNVWLKGQNVVAWLLNKLDSGLNVRSESGYLALAEGLPVTVLGTVHRGLLRIPYDHFVMVMTRC